jgi:hypothetical protein
VPAPTIQEQMKMWRPWTRRLDGDAPGRLGRRLRAVRAMAARQRDPVPLEPASAPSASETEPTAAADDRGARRFQLATVSPYWLALGVVVAAVGLVCAITWAGSRKFIDRASEERAAAEADSLAQHSAQLATGDAFSGYLQILRYAEDPQVRAPETSTQDRRAAMQRMLYLNTNRMDVLAVVDRSGLALASTHPDLLTVRGSEALESARADLGPANSDIVLADDGADPYVEYAAPLYAPDGAVWAFLYGRANPSRLWTGALLATIDGSHNVIINNKGQYSAGVPRDMLGQPWRGVPRDDGVVRTTIGGRDAVCGLGPIGKGTQIDHGWNIASCVPLGLVGVQASAAKERQTLLTLAGAALAIAVATCLLHVLLHRDEPAAASGTQAAPGEHALPQQGVAAGEASLEAAAASSEAVAVAPQADETQAEAAQVEAVPSAAPAPPVIVADADALALIEGYEERGARIADALRESVQARLLIAAARAEQAFRDAAAPELARASHASALEEIEEVRDVELRRLAQELHPGVIRLGLPAALRSLRSDFSGRIDVELDVDPAADSVDRAPGRPSIDEGRRLVLYRAARNALGALADAGAEHCTISLGREDDDVVLRLSGAGAFADDPVMRASDASVRAYGGRQEAGEGGAGEGLEIRLPAPIPAASDAGTEIDADMLAPLFTEEPPTAGLGVALGELASRHGELTVEVQAPASPVPLADAARACVLAVAGAAFEAFAGAGAADCQARVDVDASEVTLSISGDLDADAFDLAALGVGLLVEEACGTLTVARSEQSLVLTLIVSRQESDEPGLSEFREDTTAA